MSIKSFVRRIYDRHNGVLGRDYQGKALRKGDLVEPAPHVRDDEIGGGVRFQMEVAGRPDPMDRIGRAKPEGVCISPDGCRVLVSEWSVLRKLPKSHGDARWENVERLTGWSPKPVKEDIGVTA